ncbi:MAG: Holliday junction resolvase RuvX [Planctomycetota bacterium]
MKPGGVLAIDHGTKRAGFAVVDALRLVPVPLEAWRGPGGEPALFDRIQELLGDRDVATLLVGLPLDMDGGEGGRAKEVRAFAARLAARFPGVDVVFHDERLSTKSAEELLRETDLSPEERRARRDSISALVILRDWIAAGEPR